MPLETALFKLLHILVLVYWLGGDLGAFYSSRFLMASDVSPDRKRLAAKIVTDVDMAPRTALILALPTGILLAIQTGWVDWPISVGWAASAASLVWLALAWTLHTRHANTANWLKSLDLAIRFALFVALFFYGVAVLTGEIDLPVFIAIKMLLLAGAIAIGLLIRRALRPLGPALAALSDEPSNPASANLAKTLRTVRPLVAIIWALIISAAFVGFWKPTSF